MKTNVIYHMSKNYTSLTVWSCTAFRARMSTLRVVPDKALSRKARYDVLAEALYKETGVPAPSYRKLKSEQVKS